MLLVVSLIAAGFLAAFWLIFYENLDSRAEHSIDLFLHDRETYYIDNTTVPVYEMYIGENVDPPFEGSVEEELLAYYQAHPERFVANSVGRYKDFDTTLLYYPIKASNRQWDHPSRVPDYMLLVSEITYEVTLIHRNVLMVAAVLAGFVLLLFLVSRNTLKALDTKDAEMKNFFANASHELKTPLMAIKGNADGISQGYVDTDAGCAIIEKEADRMSGLISGILDISRLDCGMVEPDFVRTDIREIVYDAVSSLMQEASNRGLSIDVDVPSPVFRDCDESMLYSAFSNILANDIRYARSYIRILSAEEGDKVRFIFENDGTPISDEDIEHVFDRFYKGENGQNGIGMALAQEYVKLHGSQITVRAVEEGTVFEIVL